MRILRNILIFAGIMLLSLVLHLFVYGTNFTYESISNAMFVLGIITFLSSLIVLTGSYEVFYGIRYSLQALFTKEFRGKYPTFLEFKTEKTVTHETSFFLETIISASVIIVIAIVLARMVVQ